MSDDEGGVPDDEPAEPDIYDEDFDEGSVGTEESDDEDGADAAGADADHPFPQARPEPPPADALLRDAGRAVRETILRGGERRTRDALTSFEAAEILAVRTAQIDGGAGFFVDPLPGDDAATAIARRELLARRCPLLVHRLVWLAPGGGRVYEEWDPNEMAHPAL